MDATALANGFAALLKDRRAFAWQQPVLPAWWVAECDALREMPVEFLRVLWDMYDGCNAPLGFAGETIHAVLNERGDGAYCAV